MCTLSHVTTWSQLSIKTEEVYTTKHIQLWLYLKRETMKTASAVILFLYVFKLSRAEDCDVRMWYLKMTAKGVFDGELSEENLFIQKTINDMVLNSKKDQTKRKISCDVLEMYEEMLKPDEEGDATDTQDDKEEGQGQEKSSNTTEDTESEESASVVEMENTKEKLNEDNRQSGHDSLLTEDVNGDDKDQSVGESEETVDESTDRDTDLHNELEADETELFSDDSNDEEETEEIEELNKIEEQVMTDGLSDDLDKINHEEITSVDELEETIIINDDNSAEIHKEAIIDDGAIKESKEGKEGQNDDPQISVEKEKKPIESESERDKNVGQGQTEQIQKDNNDKKTDELHTGDSAAVNKKETKVDSLDDVSRTSEDEKESKEKDNEIEEKVSDDRTSRGSDLDRTETNTKTSDIHGGHENKESTVDDTHKLSFNTTTNRGVFKELKHAKEENDTVSFGICRKDRSYQFDIFDQVQKRYSFVQNTKHYNQTETNNNTSQNNSTLNQEISLTYSRLVCSPCSLLMNYYTANASCGVDTVNSIHTQSKSNETQNNQINTHSNNTESARGREDPNSSNTEETQTDISETATRTKNGDEENIDIESGAKTVDTNVDVSKVTSKHDKEGESEETDGKGLDKNGTPNVDSKTASIDTNAQNKLTEMEMIENNPPKQQLQGKSLQTENERRPSDEKLSTEENGSTAEQTTEQERGRHGNTETANSASSAVTKKGQDRETRANKHDDKTLTTTEQIMESKQEKEQVAAPHGEPENGGMAEKEIDKSSEAADTTVTNTEAIGTKHRTDQPEKPETTTGVKQGKPEGKQTATDEKMYPNPASGVQDHTSILEQLQSNFNHFQEQVVSKTDGYSNKLQSLELMVIKLENQLLKEKVNKNNHSSTITRMENHILRLENELLKLNQSYNEVRKESDSMVKDRKKYLELGHGSQQTPAAYGYSVMRGQAHPVSIDFQAKIGYLTNLLSNQSMTIKQLKTRSQYLEDQNRLLYNMIMNQTALMTQIMTRVQDLTEQNIQQRIEAQKIRQQMEQISRKGSFAETTDTFLMNKLEEMVSDVQKRTVDEDDKARLRQMKTPSVNKDKSEEELEKYLQSGSALPTETWCGSSSGVCVPFSLFQWKKCVESKSTKKEAQKSSSKLSGITKGTTEKEHIQKLNSTDNVSSVDVKQKEDATSSNGETGKGLQSTTKVTNKNLDAAQANDNTNTVNSKGKDTPVTEPKESDSSNGIKSQSENKEKEEIKKENPNEKPEASAKNEMGPTEEISKKVKETTLTEGKTDVKDIVQETPHPAEMGDKLAKNTLEKQEGSDTTTKVSSESETGGKVAEHSTGEGGEKIKTSSPEADLNTLAKTDKASDATSSNVNPKTTNVDENAPGTTTEKEVSGRKESEDKAGELKPNEDITQQKVAEPSKEAILEKGTTSPEQENNKLTESTNKDEKIDDTKQEKETNKELTKETSVKSVVKDQAKEIQETKTEPKKEEIQDVQKEQPNKEVPKAKETKEVKVKSQEKKPKEPLKKPIKYEAAGQKEPKDCYDYYKRGKQKNGVFKIKPYGKKSMVEVFCDMKNGGWTLIQKRQDGTTKFLKKWQDFKEGFGGIRGEHWLGNDYIHYLTNQDHYTLRIELTDWNKTKKFAEYEYFMIDDEKDGYRLHIGGYHGDAGDGMAKHNNNKFSTIDVDNDKVTKEFGGSCAKRFSGAWWYYKCYMSNLNGIFYRNGVIPPKMFDGVAWKPWTGSNYSLRSAEMKIRPSNVSS